MHGKSIRRGGCSSLKGLVNFEPAVFDDLRVCYFLSLPSFRYAFLLCERAELSKFRLLGTVFSYFDSGDGGRSNRFVTGFDEAGFILSLLFGTCFSPSIAVAVGFGGWVTGFDRVA